MHVRDFDLGDFLRSVSGTRPFADYCRTRGILLGSQTGPGAADLLPQWARAVGRLPARRRARVESELTRVNELAGREGVAHLLEVAGVLPPPSVPTGAPLALWYFLHDPQFFREVFYHHEGHEVRAWRVARAAPGLLQGDLHQKAEALGEGVQKVFRLGSEAGQFCAVEIRQIQDVYCFSVRVADRPCLVEWFTDRGRLAADRVRPALTASFAYHSTDGTVLLDSSLRPADRLDEMLRCFAEAVLAAPVTGFADVFDLERLKHPFHPPPDGTDMELVRVKNLHLRYPAHRGPRRVKLETLSSDSPTAMEEMLRDHLGGGGVTAEELSVTHAEIQVRLRVGDGSRNYLIQLWPDRCNLGPTPIGTRLLGCLRRWHLLHAW